MLKEESEKMLMEEKHKRDKETLQVEHENSIREMVEIQVLPVIISAVPSKKIIVHVLNSQT